MFDDPHKLNVPGKGYKTIVKKKKVKQDKNDKYFDPDAQTNWLFNDDKEYKQPRKSKKKLKKKK
jgi:hypothetical protein